MPSELVKIGEQSCKNALDMTKEMLGNYEGQDFNMAFLGQQTFSHVLMLAELKAIQSSGPQELQPVAEQAITTIEKHLEQTKQLAKKLEDQERLGS